MSQQLTDNQYFTQSFTGDYRGEACFHLSLYHIAAALIRKEFDRFNQCGDYDVAITLNTDNRDYRYVVTVIWRDQTMRDVEIFDTYAPTIIGAAALFVDWLEKKLKSGVEDMKNQHAKERVTYEHKATKMAALVQSALSSNGDAFSVYIPSFSSSLAGRLFIHFDAPDGNRDSYIAYMETGKIDIAAGHEISLSHALDLDYNATAMAKLTAAAQIRNAWAYAYGEQFTISYT